MRALADLFQRSDALDLQENHRAHVFRSDAIRIDREPVVQDVAAHMKRYLRARSMVMTDREMNGGAPTLRGTRVRVHNLAAVLIKRGTEETRAIYPELADDEMDAAELYSAVHPRVERAVVRRLPRNAQLVSCRRFALADLPERST